MSYITAIGTANPGLPLSQRELADLVCARIQLKPAEQRLLKSIYKSSGIDYRHSILSPADADYFSSTAERMKKYKLHALQLCLQAIENCVSSMAEFNSQGITHLITVSCTGMYAPGLDVEIIQHLNLNSSIHRTAVNFMGCYGAFNALKIAHAICQADRQAQVLVVSVELCTLHFQDRADLDNITANAIFADGAAAVIIQASPAAGLSICLQDFYCDLLPQTQEQMAWRIGDLGFDIVLSSYVPDSIEYGINTFVSGLLDKHQLAVSNIDYYAIHPGGLKILKACEKALNISAEDNVFSYRILRNYGNMSSATVLFILKEIWGSLNQDDHDKKILSCAFGPGLTLESMLLKIHYRDRYCEER